MVNIYNVNNKTFAQSREQEPCKSVPSFGNLINLAKPENSIIELSEYQELIGVYKGCNITASSIYIYIDDKTLIVPFTDALVVILNNQSNIGKNIGVLRTDIPHKPFLIRILGE